MSQAAAIGLFRLPAKVRFKIYEHVLSGEVICYLSKRIGRTSLVFEEGPQAPGLLLASKQIYQEIIGFYYAMSNFRFNDICRLLDWARNMCHRRTEKPPSVCLVMDIHSMKERSRSSTADSTVEKLSETCANMANGDGNSFIDTFFEPMKDQTMGIIDKQFGGEEDSKETHELTLRAAREALQDDINLAAENVPRFRSALVGEVYTIEGDLPQLSATVIPQSIFTKRSQRTAVDAQYEQILHRWGPFDDPFLDTAPGPGGLSRRTRALVKLCGVVLPGEKAEHEIREVGESEADAESSEPVAVYADDPFVDTPLRKSRSLKRTDSAIDLGECRGGRAEGASTGMCKQPAYRELSPIKRVYPHGSMWKNAVVPRFEPSPSRCIWA